MILTFEKLQLIASGDVSLFEANDIAKKLIEELDKPGVYGIGLAAPQIGIYKNVFVVKTTEGIKTFANPEIIEQTDLMEFEGEGCLSFPGKYLFTKRYNQIRIKDDINGELVVVGMDAVVIQHEYSHLIGQTMFNYEIKRPGVNDKCWCGSDKKYKKCHMGKIIRS